MSIIKLENISKLDENNNLILDNITCEILKGDVVVIIGPSGSGKSTLLRCLNGIEAISSGSIMVDQLEVNSKNLKKIRTKIGMVFQNFNLFSNMNILQNLIYAPVNVLKINKSKAIDNARDLLEKIKLSDKEDYYPNKLSGGQKQRVAIARALAMNPEILLFDEPTSALDLEMTSEVLETIKLFIKKGMTSIIVTHELQFAKDIATKIMFLDKGKIVEVSESEEFFTKPKTERAKIFLQKTLQK